jgi:SAM-dependent methyltransferase
MFFKRSYEPEILDDFSIKDGRVDKALKELDFINSYLGGNRLSREGINKFNTGDEILNILDVGAGASDILLRIKRKHKNITIFCLDKNQRTCQYLKQNSTDINIICGDVLNLPFRTRFDLIHASLFFHHFNEDDLKRIIISLLMVSSKGIVINDLRRSIFAWLGIKMLTFVFSKSREVKFDGPLSVRRGFIKKDWTDILNKIVPGRYEMKRRWAFRWLIVIYK